jgi:acyl carrier protein
MVEFPFSEGPTVMTPIQAELRGQVRRFLEENFVLDARAAALGDEDSFIEHQVLDSTGFMELVAWLEERYGLKVADDEMVPENLDTLANVATYVERKRGAHPTTLGVAAAVSS